jgi:hypothetical protein
MGLHVGRRKSGSEDSIVDDGVPSKHEVDHRETKAEVRELLSRAGLKQTERAVIHAMCLLDCQIISPCLGNLDFGCAN